MSHAHVILKNNLFLEDKQMIFLSLFDKSTGFRFTKNLKELGIHFLRSPWIKLGTLKTALCLFFVPRPLEKSCFTSERVQILNLLRLILYPSHSMFGNTYIVVVSSKCLLGFLLLFGGHVLWCVSPLAFLQHCL